ncbi:MAG: DUF2878 domain-containing protein [Gammaproteobacteria bacterium]|nr:DUF2878 domain-containing protein [Gammaproteobacteria bacterium]MDH5304510.1 DUF2878 domain-containing protein [Gammaproteobacteria bacterium]
MLYILNFLTFQAGWFSSVYGGAKQMPWLGPLAVALVLLLHFSLARGRRAELMLILSCAAIGAAFDSSLVAMDWVQYPSGMFSEFAAPFWIITMWMLFATTLNVSMRWLRERPALASICGLTGGPLTYLAGQQLGGIVLLEPLPALLALGIGWAVMMPMLLRLSAIFDGFAAPAGDRMATVAVAEPGR